MTALPLTGREPFHGAGQQLDHRLLDLWAWANPELLSNALRGRLAEFVVLDLVVAGGIRTEWVSFVLKVAGGITVEGKISKPTTARDRYRLNHASIVSREILIKAGCDPDSVFVSPLRGTHPSATVRIGEMVDTNLQTEIKNLYVCDASTFPEALDRPPVLTIIGLGKRLSDRLLNTVFRKRTTKKPTRRVPAASAKR